MKSLMHGKRFKLIGAVTLGLIVAVTSMPLKGYADESLYDNLLDIVSEAVTYSDYLESHKAVYPNTEVRVTEKNVTELGEGFYVTDDGVYTAEEGMVTFTADVAKEGFYAINFEYETTPGKNNSIERKIYINGEVPFDNAQYLKFTRAFTDAEEIVRDSRDNDVRPRQKEVYKTVNTYLKDADGYYTEPFLFYFEKGENTIGFESVKEPVIIKSLTLTKSPELIDYATYINNAEALGAKPTSGISVTLQAEDTFEKSDSTLYPIADRTSPNTEPYSPSKTRLNEVGGANWKTIGQWISWEVEVPEDGLYTISLRARQNINTGATVSRSLSIDGEVPFKEASELTFSYKNEWVIETLGNNDGAYSFYLTKGTHEIRLDAVPGTTLSSIIQKTDECIEELNKAYRQLLMVIGTSPDTYRDYQLTEKTPEALNTLKEQYTNLCEIRTLFENYSMGKGGSGKAAIDNLVNQLEKMNEKPETIAKQWAAFKDNIVALGSWELSMKEQPLEIDYFLINSEDVKLPKAEAGFFKQVAHEIKQFAASFVEDYDSIGEVYEGEEAIEVWILADGSNVTSMTGSGRDQATVIKQLVDNYFVPDTGISVNVKLVNKDVLLSATLAGEGPDVALNVAGKEPVNYALRHAVTDLTQFDDFEEVKGWFYEDALTQFTFEDGVYALPQTMSFHVMFYRADILKELGLEVPNNWDEFYECLSVIQKANMNIGIFPDYTTFAMFLYQHGGEYYSEDGMKSGLSSEEAVAAFKQWSDNYVNYRMPVTFDFANRFRTGEMPLAIGDYTNYNYLSVFAPEIRGLWGFTIVPGFERADGSYDRSVSAWESGSIIMETSEHKEAGWEFLKWWMSAETQSSYGNEIESVLGVSGRVATANLEALEALPWSARDLKILKDQMQEVKAIPEIPGSYYTERNIKNAFYTVYNNNEDQRETLQDIVKVINTEIKSKREEFNLPVE